MRVAPVQDIREVVDQPQTRARNMVVTVKDPVMGELIMQGNPIKMPKFPDPPKRNPAPNLGEHNERITKELRQG